MINCKSPREIALMQESGRIIGLLFKEIREYIKPGISTLALDEECERIIRREGGIPASKGYYGFPGATCVSVNETLVHGIPSNKIILKEGDIVTIDVVVKKAGYCADAARTFPVGIISERAKRLIDTTRESWWYASQFIKAGNKLGDVSHAIQEYNESRGYSLPREYTGHGIGRDMHEDPSIPNTGLAGTGVTLQEGMALAIEPMVAEGKPQVRVLGDGWTAKMKDGKLSAHYENTVIVTKDGFLPLTLEEEEKN